MVQTVHPLTGTVRGIIANLLLEILEGKISDSTRTAIADFGDLQQISGQLPHLFNVLLDGL